MNSQVSGIRLKMILPCRGRKKYSRKEKLKNS
jgi:hypothetical protein